MASCGSKTRELAEAHRSFQTSRDRDNRAEARDSEWSDDDESSHGISNVMRTAKERVRSLLRLRILSIVRRCNQELEEGRGCCQRLACDKIPSSHVLSADMRMICGVLQHLLTVVQADCTLSYPRFGHSPMAHVPEPMTRFWFIDIAP